MFKSKLQEFCQSKAWLLPEYSTSREGFDHCPRFKASVVVNGATFVTPDFSKSSKDAQNFVAMLAFQHLTGATGANPASPVAATSATPQQSQPSETVQATPLNIVNATNDQKPKGATGANLASPVTATSATPQQSQPSEAVQATPLNIVNATNDQKPKDMSRLYKSQLQSYAQKRNLNLPVYVSEREGPPHAPRFKCKVTLEGNTYECQDYFCTLKDAENAAAKVALTSVSSVGIEEEDPGVFKNLLQELAQKGYSCLPEYNTNSSGPSHSPLFISTVIIKGESFVGQASKTKKLAEMYAAKAAYAALKERKSTQDPKQVFPGPSVDGTPQPCSSKFQSFPQVEPPQRTVVAPHTGSSTASSEHTMFNQGNSPQDSKNVFVGSHVADTPQPQSSSKFQSFPQVEPCQRTILTPTMEPNMASSQHVTYNQGAYQKPPELNHAVTQREGSPKPVQNTSELKPEELPFSRGPSCSPTHPAQPPSNSGLSAYNTPWAGSHVSSAHKKVKVFPREQNITLPPGAIITHEDEKWISVAVDSIHGNA